MTKPRVPLIGIGRAPPEDATRTSLIFIHIDDDDGELKGLPILSLLFDQTFQRNRQFRFITLSADGGGLSGLWCGIGLGWLHLSRWGRWHTRGRDTEEITSTAQAPVGIPRREPPRIQSNFQAVPGADVII